MSKVSSVWSDLWNVAMNEWQISSTRSFYEAFIKKAFIVEHKNTGSTETVVVGLNHALMIDQIKQRSFDFTIQETLSRLSGKNVRVEYVVAAQPDTTDYSKEAPLFSQPAPTTSGGDLLKLELERHHLKVECSLENYAVSSSNEMAYAAARAVAQRPGAAYNPLFLYGGVGVGKTHLMQAIGQEILKDNLNTRIIYCSGEDFTNSIIEAIQKKNTSNFRNKYRTVRLLLIDDIQFIAGKNSVQEEFFHTFNAVTAAGGQVIMTSDKPPKEIDSLEARLRSRFEGGLTIDIGNPDFELRCAILMIKAEQLQISVDSEIIHLIAEREADTRALVGKLVTLSTMAKDTNQPLDLSLAQKLIQNLPQQKSRVEPPKADEVISALANFYSQPVAAILGSSRVKTLTLPRHLCMYILREDLFLNYKDIGKKFNNRDHTSVMHAVTKVEKMLKADSEVFQDLNQIRATLNIDRGKTL